MAIIQKIHAREVLDSRGNPTVEAEVHTEHGVFRSIVPSGASTGIHEAVELRDGGDRFGGKGVLEAVRHVNEDIAPLLVGKECTAQQELDKLMNELDGTPNKGKLGANAILAVSMSVCKAGAASTGLPLYRYIGGLFGNEDYVLPVPSFNVINGGKHAGNGLSFQEYMMLPVGAKNFHEALRMGAEVYQTLKELIKERYGKDAINVGDEGGFAPPLTFVKEPLDVLNEAVNKAGYKGQIKLGLDAAASEFYEEGLYFVDDQKISGEELGTKYKQLIEQFPIASIEDPFEQDDFDSYAALTADSGVQIVGDDLLVTNVQRMKMADEQQACNALLLKVNQIGSITEALDAARFAKEKQWGIMVSHRSGDTEDTFIADLAVGIKAGQIKSGALSRSERISKYNQLLRIEEELGEQGRYAGEAFRFP
ncbi:phosphopyruvate hydratase [Candidatus Woesearchaeota archaeon]|nr:phosphopyruvate hydratase [Candidatus Woesearchaeota archaeon]